MPKTRQELVYRALSDLGALPVGQIPSTQEVQSVDALVEPVIDGLMARDIYYVPDLQAIADEAFIPLGRCLAWAAAPEFGLHQDSALAALNQQAEQHLKIMQSEVPTYKVLEFKAW
jgi:hypothetical protein